MPKTKKKILVHVNVTPEQYEQMLEMRRRVGIPLAEIQRRAITAYLAPRPLQPQPPTTSPREETITT